jgi:type IV pilus assembly protein PilX
MCIEMTNRGKTVFKRDFGSVADPNAFDGNARYGAREGGASLLMVMLILIVVSILGVGGAQIALMSERGARNERDYQVAWQATEAALLDAEFDMRGPDVGTRRPTFDNVSTNEFLDGCGDSSSGNSYGLCQPALTGKPVWVATDFTAANSPTVPFGQFTGRAFDVGTTGVRPEVKPRYLIEILEDKETFSDLRVGKKKFIYRVTAMGFGPRKDIQTVMQMVFRKE